MLWSWLYIVDVGRLAEITWVAYFSITIVLLFIVSISAKIFSLAIIYLKDSYKKIMDWLWILKAVAVWALAEAMVAWLVALVWIGRNGSIDNILPFSTFTPFVVLTPLKYIARFVGFYGLSAVTVVGVALLVFKKTRRYAIGYWTIIVALSLFGWIIYKTPNGTTINATIVAEHLGEPQPINANGTNLIVVPEYGLDEYSQQTISSRFANATNDFNYLGSKQSVVKTGHNNVLVFGNSHRGFIKEQPKNRLIAGGEHLSFWGQGLLELISPSTVSDFQVRREVIKGQEPITAFYIDDNTVVGAAVCSSIISPIDYRNFTKQGATLFTNSASLEIFRGSRLFNWQHRGFAKFMAVANARPFLQSSNNWQAFAIDKDGNQLAEIDPQAAQQVSIETNRKKTPYTLIGEWLPYLGAGFIAYDIYEKRYSNKNKTKKSKKSIIKR